MPLSISQYASLIVGTLDSVFPTAHCAIRDGKWVELINDPVCIATFTQGEFGDKTARLLGGAPELIKISRDTITHYMPRDEKDCDKKGTSLKRNVLALVEAAILK